MNWFKKSLILIWKQFIYGGHLLCLGAASIVFTSSVLLEKSIAWHGLIAIYLIFYAIYALDRLKGLKQDYKDNIERTKHIICYARVFPELLIVSVFGAVFFLVYFASAAGLIFGIILLIFGLLYYYFFKKITKHIPLFKNLYVSLFFASLVFFPLFYHDYSLTKPLVSGAVILLSFIFLKSFIMQTFLDIKDKAQDAEQGLKTLPVLLDSRRVFHALKISAVLVSFIMPIAFSIIWPVMPKIFLVFLLTIPFNFYCFNLAQRQKYSAYVLASSEFTLWLVLVLISQAII